VTRTVTPSFFGMTVHSYDYNFGFDHAPVEAWPAADPSVVRSWNVWSPGNGQIEYLSWGSLEPSAGTFNWTAWKRRRCLFDARRYLAPFCCLETNQQRAKRRWRFQRPYRRGEGHC
jgi:hypothetical protein